MKRALMASLAAYALSLGASVAAAGTLADVNVINRTTGQRLPVYAHGGRLYVAGNPGDRYAVQIDNRTGGRILAVVSVDGVNVVSGETAASDQTGYVLSSSQSYEISGWRKNADEVAAFYFTSLPDSYAARTDRPGNVGVIGVAVFREWSPPRPRPQPHPRPFEGAAGRSQESAKRADASEAQAADSATNMHESAGVRQEAERAAPASPSAPIRQRDKLGTGHGEREASAVTFTDFRRASARPNEVLSIYYDRYENLLARGIIPGTPRYADPQPFPGGIRFAPDPRS